MVTAKCEAKENMIGKSRSFDKKCQAVLCRIRSQATQILDLMDRSTVSFTCSLQYKLALCTITRSKSDLVNSILMHLSSSWMVIILILHSLKKICREHPAQEKILWHPLSEPLPKSLQKLQLAQHSVTELIRMLPQEKAVTKNQPFSLRHCHQLYSLAPLHHQLHTSTRRHLTCLRPVRVSPNGEFVIPIASHKQPSTAY